MSAAWSTIPHIANVDELDATELLEARARLRRAAGARGELIGVVPLLVMAAVRTLRRFPLLNATLDPSGTEVEVHADIHLGLAVATTDGLIVPVIRHAGRRDLLDLATEMDRLATAARTRTLRLEELGGGTFTVTNFGSLGGRFSVPIIRPPEVAILGLGAIAPRPLVVDGAGGRAAGAALLGDRRPPRPRRRRHLRRQRRPRRDPHQPDQPPALGAGRGRR